MKQIKISSGMHQRMQRKQKREVVRRNLNGFKKLQLCRKDRVKTDINFTVAEFKSVPAGKRESKPVHMLSAKVRITSRTLPGLTSL